MDFSLTQAQHDLAGLTRRVLDDHATPARLSEIEADTDRFDPDLWAALASTDVLRAGLPTEIGGSGFGILEQCSALVEIGRAVAPVPYLASITTAASALARFGTPEQRERWAAPAASGELVLTAALVEEHGPDPATPTAHAERVDGNWRVSGTKTAVPTGGIAELILVPVVTADGPLVVLVEPTDPGVSIQRQQVVDFDSEARIELDGVDLTGDRVLGGDPSAVAAPSGRQALDWMLARATLGLCAAQLGVTERAVELTADYARERVQFGRAIGGFQAVSQRLADAHIDVEAIRMTLWQAAWLLSEDLPAEVEVATAKFWAAEAGHRVAHTAVHVHGGVGIDVEHALHRYFVAAKRNEFALGGATEQLVRIGSHLAENPADPDEAHRSRV